MADTMQFVGIEGATVEILANKTLFVGMPSESGLGQIAVEGMYSALNAKGLVRRVGYLKTPFLSPISGYVTESNGEKVLIHNAEVFVHLEQSLVFVLFRSPCLHGTEVLFSSSLMRFVSTWSPSLVVLLTGASREGWDLSPYHTQHLAVYSEAAWTQAEALFPRLSSQKIQVHLTVSSNGSSSDPIWHELNQSDASYPQGMALTVTALNDIYASSSSSSSLRERVCVFGMFDQGAEHPLRSGLQWTKELLSSCIFPHADTEALSRALEVDIERSLPVLWRQLLAEAM